MTFPSPKTLAFVFALPCLTSACDSGDDGGTSTTQAEDGGSTESTESGWTSGSDDGVVLGDIDVTVDYAGSMEGMLTVGAFPACPPENPPVSFKRVDMPVFPLDVTLVDIESGEWCVYAFIDLPPENPTFPGDEDPQGFVEGIVVDGDVPSTSITIVDP